MYLYCLLCAYIYIVEPAIKERLVLFQSLVYMTNLPIFSYTLNFNVTPF